MKNSSDYNSHRKAREVEGMKTNLRQLPYAQVKDHLEKQNLLRARKSTLMDPTAMSSFFCT
jgi:hypothetical protein